MIHEHEVVAAVVAAVNAKMDTKFDELRSELAPKKDPTPTPATLGQMTRESVEGAGGLILFKPCADGDGDGDSILDAHDRELLLKCKNETDVVVFLEPILQRFVDDLDVGFKLFDSQEVPWLGASDVEDHAARKKPDLFGASIFAFNAATRCPDRIADALLRSSCSDEIRASIVSRQGGVNDFRLIKNGFVSLVCEFKTDIGDRANEPLGQLCLYHERVPYVTSFGILGDRHGFWLTVAMSGTVNRITGKVPWSARGSARVLREHIALAKNAVGPAAVAANELSKLLNVTPVDGAAFLGAGATGWVFRVRDNGDATELAMKIVLFENRLGLAQEFDLLKACSADASDVVARVDGVRAVVIIDGVGAAFCYKDVGRRVECTKANVKRVFAALRRLHERGFFHGDARLPNIIDISSTHDDDDAKGDEDTKNGDGFRWIDFMAGARAGIRPDEFARADYTTLSKSFLHLSPRHALSERLIQAIQACSNEAVAGNAPRSDIFLGELVVAVVNEMGGAP